MMSILRRNTDRFLSQPHQPFFAAGIVWAIVAMTVFILGYKGIVVLSVPPAFFHAYAMLFIVFTPFLTGFIFTTFPRFCQSEVIAPHRWRTRLFVQQAASVFFVAGALVSAWLAAAAAVALFVSQIMIVSVLQRVYETGRASRITPDPVWILAGFHMGLLAHLLFLVTAVAAPSDDTLFRIAAAIGFWLYLTFTVFAVAQRMVPFFSHVMTDKTPAFAATVFAALVAKVVCIVFGLHLLQAFVDAALFFYLLREFRRWKLGALHAPAILWVLHLALYWLPAALAAGALADLAAARGYGENFLSLHLAALGFATTMLIGFGTRVTLGHSGQTPHADRFAVALFVLVQLTLVARALYAVSIPAGWNALWLFDLSGTFWVLLFFLWGLRYGPVLAVGKKLKKF